MKGRIFIFSLQGFKRFSLDAETNHVTRRQLNEQMVSYGRHLQSVLCAGKRGRAFDWMIMKRQNSVAGKFS